MTRHPESVDQSDRIVPINLRQSGRTPTELLISTRVRKSPYWHLSHEAGCWRATVYNRIYHPRGYVRPEDGGASVEYEALTKHVTMWNVAVERQIRVKGPDAEQFTDYVITRDATRIEPMHAKYVILCNERGGILNDPVLLRLSEDEFWFSLADSDLLFWLQGVNVGMKMDVEIDEIDVCPLQIQGPKSLDLMADLVGEGIRDIPYYGLMEAEIGGCGGGDLPVRLLGGEGLRDLPPGRHPARREALVRGARGGQGPPAHGHRPGPPAPHPGRHPVLGAGHRPRDGALPVQPRLPGPAQASGATTSAGRRSSGCASEIDAGRPPFAMIMAGMTMGGRPIDDYAPDFWLVSDADGGDPIGYLTSPWYAPELGTNIAMGYVPVGQVRVSGPRSRCGCPTSTRASPGKPDRAEVCEVPFRPSVNPSARERARGQRRGRGGIGIAEWRGSSSTASLRSIGGASLPGRAAGLSRASRDGRARRAGARENGRGRLRSPSPRRSPRIRSARRTILARAAALRRSFMHGGDAARGLPGSGRVDRARSGRDLRGPADPPPPAERRRPTRDAGCATFPRTGTPGART